MDRETPRDQFSDDEADTPIGGGASGAAPSFDGNDQIRIVSWLFPNKGWVNSKVPLMLDELMQYTCLGHLAWVVFVPHGFRIEETLDLRGVDL